MSLVDLCQKFQEIMRTFEFLKLFIERTSFLREDTRFPEDSKLTHHPIRTSVLVKLIEDAKTPFEGRTVTKIIFNAPRLKDT